MKREVEITAGGRRLQGTLTLPEGSAALVIFAHGSGSSRHSPRNQQVARTLQEGGIGTPAEKGGGSRGREGRTHPAA